MRGQRGSNVTYGQQEQILKNVATFTPPRRRDARRAKAREAREAAKQQLAVNTKPTRAKEPREDALPQEEARDDLAWQVYPDLALEEYDDMAWEEYDDMAWEKGLFEIGGPHDIGRRDVSQGDEWDSD